MANEYEKRTKEQDVQDERKEVPHRTGGQAEGEREEEDIETPIERKRPSQAEG